MPFYADTDTDPDNYNKIDYDRISKTDHLLFHFLKWVHCKYRIWCLKKHAYNANANTNTNTNGLQSEPKNPRNTLTLDHNMFMKSWTVHRQTARQLQTGRPRHSYRRADSTTVTNRQTAPQFQTGRQHHSSRRTDSTTVTNRQTAPQFQMDRQHHSYKQADSTTVTSRQTAPQLQTDRQHHSYRRADSTTVTDGQTTT